MRSLLVICLIIVALNVCVECLTKKNYLIQFWFLSPEPGVGFAEKLANYNDSKIFNPALPTKIAIHGFKGTCNKLGIVLQAFKEIGSSNNICIDWDGKTRAREYFEARSLVPLIALYIANMVNDVRMNPVHCIGHSLGAHICHMAAAKLKELSERSFQRLTLCDPAVIQSDEIKRSARLIPLSSDLTEVIHTNIQNSRIAGFTSHHLGYSHPMGDFDFYPNGGQSQPSCNRQTKCEHSISFYYFAEAIKNPLAYPTYRCTSLEKAKRGACFPSDVYMGNTDTYTEYNKGIYWLSTSEHGPNINATVPLIQSKL